MLTLLKREEEEAGTVTKDCDDGEIGEEDKGE